MLLKIPLLQCPLYIILYYIYKGLKRVIITKNNYSKTNSFPNDDDDDDERHFYD